MRAYVVFAALGTCATLALASPSLDGRWQGSVALPGGDVACILDLDHDAGGMWIGSVTFPEWNVRGAALGDIVVQGDQAKLSLKDRLGGPADAKAAFQAKLAPDGTLSGEFTQAGNKARFALRRTGAAEVELPPTSTPVPQELEGPWVGEFIGVGGYVRHVTITLKRDAGGAAGAEFVSVGKQRIDLPVDLVTYAEQVLRVQSAATGVAFEGRYAPGPGEISGTVEVGALEFPLVLKRQAGATP
jgi:hypothetical protein